ncbi:YfiR family protein [Desulfonema magnum]|uniref:YfiR-like (DUF4154) domain-containing protein n=1 Tax=Desulfonema magnum TaxID=45655 RepID=A0A975BIJ9_9BACT|nr:YfiR family protein [Desulfonema magnum]QTA86057.1 YfiR-like (DUF4154) domain-containing protein [Desulfonema magnum]
MHNKFQKGELFRIFFRMPVIIILCLMVFTVFQTHAQERGRPPKTERSDQHIRSRSLPKSEPDRFCRMKHSSHSHGKFVLGNEYHVKAGFIYNFIKFTKWPRKTFQNSTSPFALCIASDSFFNDIISSLGLKIPGCSENEAFRILGGKNVRGRKLDIKECNNDKDIQGCHVLFICSENKEFILDVLNTAKNQNILTIGEFQGFERMGGIINFFTEKNRLRFRINIDAANRAGLKLRSQLLMSAEIFREERE